MTDEPEDRIVEWFRQSKTERGEMWVSRAGWVSGQYMTWTYGIFDNSGAANRIGSCQKREDAMAKLEKRFEPQLLKAIENALMTERVVRCPKCGLTKPMERNTQRFCGCTGAATTRMEEVEI